MQDRVKQRTKQLTELIDQSALVNNTILSASFFEARHRIAESAEKKKKLLGVEFQPKVKDSFDLVNYIVDNQKHSLDHDLRRDLRLATDNEFERKSVLKDHKDLGTLLGLAIGLAVALSITKFSMSVWAIVIGVVVGACLGRVAGGFLRTRLRRSTVKVRDILKNFFESYLNTLNRYANDLEYDVNSFRILLESSLDKFRLPLYLCKQSHTEDFFELLVSLEAILSSKTGYNAMNLSWKLFLLDCKAHIEEDNIPAIWSKYNDIYSAYREVLLTVWEKKNNTKVNPVLDEIRAFEGLDSIMNGFQFNMINNIYVPTEQELNKSIEAAQYQDHVGFINREIEICPSERVLNRGGSSESKKEFYDGPAKIEVPIDININEVCENILKIPGKSIQNSQISKSGRNLHVTQQSPLESKAIQPTDVEIGNVEPIPLPIALQTEEHEEVPLQEIKKQESVHLSKKQIERDPVIEPMKQSQLLHAEEEQGAINKNLERLLELEAWDVREWDEVHRSEFIEVYKRKDEDSPVIMIKAYSLMKDIPPEKVFRLIYDLDIRSEWDTVLSNMKIFDKINENVDHMYSLFKAPFGVSNRDFCQRRTKSMGFKNTSFMIHFVSVDHKECPVIKGTVRAHTTISGYIIRPSTRYPGSTQMTILTQTDIKGLVPKMIVNMAAAKAPSDWCKNFKKNADKLIKQGKL